MKVKSNETRPSLRTRKGREYHMGRTPPTTSDTGRYLSDYSTSQLFYITVANAAVKSAHFQQFMVGADSDDPTFFHNNDPVR